MWARKADHIFLDQANILMKFYLVNDLIAKIIMFK